MSVFYSQILHRDHHIIRAISVFPADYAKTLNIGDIATGATHTTGKSTEIINNDILRDANIQIQTGFSHSSLQVF